MDKIDTTFVVAPLTADALPLVASDWLPDDDAVETLLTMLKTDWANDDANGVVAELSCADAADKANPAAATCTAGEISAGTDTIDEINNMDCVADRMSVTPAPPLLLLINVARAAKTCERKAVRCATAALSVCALADAVSATLSGPTNCAAVSKLPDCAASATPLSAVVPNEATAAGVDTSGLLMLAETNTRVVEPQRFRIETPSCKGAGRPVASIPAGNNTCMSAPS